MQLSSLSMSLLATATRQYTNAPTFKLGLFRFEAPSKARWGNKPGVLHIYGFKVGIRGKNERAEAFCFTRFSARGFLSSLPSSSHLPSKNVDAVMLGAAVFHNTYDRVVALGDVLRKK